MVVAVLCVAGCTKVSSSTGTSRPTATTSSASTFVSGSPWSGSLVPVALPLPVNSAAAVTCATASDCWAVGSTVGSDGAPNGAAIIATNNGGMTWTVQAVPATVGFLSAIACSTRRQCVAMGQGQGTQGVAITTVNGGTTWLQTTLPTAVTDVTAVTCQAGVQCMAVGSTDAGDVALTSSGASSPWTQVGSLPTGIEGVRSISCVGATDCWATGYTLLNADHVSGQVVQTATGGTSWLTLPVPQAAGYLNGVSCVVGPVDQAGALPTTTVAPAPTTTGVTAVGSAPSTSTTVPAPTSTTTSTVPAPAGAGDAGVRCAVVGTTSATVVGIRSGRALIFTTDNGGATWSEQTVSATAASLLGVSCTAVHTCLSVGNTTAATTPAGLLVFTGSTDRPWSRPTVLTQPQSLTGVTCVSTTQCVVVGESVTDHLAAP